MNEGTTCYLNSLLQTLFMIKQFRNAIFSVPTIAEDGLNTMLDKKISFGLQKIFFNLMCTDVG